MKKSLVIIFALLIMPVVATAKSIDKDVLLTPEGTVYTVESVAAQSGTTVLRMTIQNGENTQATYVPDTLAAGYQRNPALAYDSDSQTLFVLWERGITEPVRHDIIVTSFKQGKWGQATRIPSPGTDHYENLRLGVTRSIDHPADSAKVKELHLHAVWWSDSKELDREWARYAMLTVQAGEVVAITVHDMSQFITSKDELQGSQESAKLDPEILRHPALIESSNGESIDVIFGSFVTKSLHRVTLKPTFDGRLRIPIGVREGGLGQPAFADVNGARISTIASGDRIVFYLETGDAVKYVLYDGAWSPERSIAITETVNADAAVEAIRRMLARN